MVVDPKMQGTFDKVLKQGLQAVTSEKVSAGVAQDAQSRGPDAAIVEAILQALQGVKQAAASGGMDVPPEVMQAAAVAMAQVMIAMMVDAGMADNPDEILKSVVQQLKGA